MRIITGQAKGRALFAPQGSETRPTSDKIRGSVFNILGGFVEGARVLDLFGGTGALALEALSRGAAYALISDSARMAIQAIERNARNVLNDGYETRARILKCDYRTAIEKAEGSFDLVFLDPPYRMTDAYGDALRRLKDADKLARGCIIVVERRRDAEVMLPDEFECYDERSYGDTVVAFVRLQ